MDTESMDAALRRLDPRQVQLLRLTARPGMTYQRVAEAVGSTPREVCRDLRSALFSLRSWA